MKYCAFFWPCDIWMLNIFFEKTFDRLIFFGFQRFYYRANVGYKWYLLVPRRIFFMSIYLTLPLMQKLERIDKCDLQKFRFCPTLKAHKMETLYAKEFIFVPFWSTIILLWRPYKRKGFFESWFLNYFQPWVHCAVVNAVTTG